MVLDLNNFRTPKNENTLQAFNDLTNLKFFLQNKKPDSFLPIINQELPGTSRQPSSGTLKTTLARPTPPPPTQLSEAYNAIKRAEEFVYLYIE